MHQRGLETTMGSRVSSLALDKVSNCLNVLRGPRPEKMSSHGADKEGVIGPGHHHVSRDLMTVTACKISPEWGMILGFPAQRCWPATIRTANSEYSRQ